MTTHSLTCPYCEQSFAYDGYTADKDLSTHKARCPKKRYLGGKLEMDTARDARDLMALDEL